MKEEKKQLKELVLNKSLVVDEQAKKIITTAENGRYSYYDYNKEIVEKIAHKNIHTTTWEDFATLTQALFPKHLIGSGLIDCLLLFNIENGQRVDPPEFYYNYVGSFLNNNKELKYNNIFFEIMDLFEKNNIVPDDEWKSLKRELEIVYGVSDDE